MGKSTVEKPAINSVLIVIGKIIAKEEVHDYRSHSSKFKHTILVYTVDVVETFKGKVKRNKIKIYTGHGHGDCGYNFQIGKEYIIYAECDYNINYNNIPKHYKKRLRKKIFRTNICRRTTLLENAKEDLEFYKK